MSLKNIYTCFPGGKHKALTFSFDDGRKEDRRALEELVETPVCGLAYPNGSYTHKIQELLPALGIRYARTVRSAQDFAIPEDFTEWNPTCHFRRGMLELGQQFLTMHKTQYLYLMYVWGHSYELLEQDGWAQMEQFCKTMSHQDDIWYATNIEIVNALENASRLQFTVNGDLCYNPNAASCWVSVGGKNYELPGGTTTRFE